jgi:outer membrane lipoprotein LolB
VSTEKCDYDGARQLTDILFMKIHFVLIVLLALFLSACANKLPLKSVEFKTHQAALAPVTDWKFNGKLGIKTQSDSGSASIRWHQQSSAYDIQLHGPLGQKSIAIWGDHQEVSLKEKGKTIIKARSPEALIKKATGWNLPLTQLNYWVRGLPAPKTNIKQITPNTTGLIAQLEQSGWVIDYQSYHQIQHQNQLIYLPKKIVATHGDIRLTLVIREWTL